VFDLYMRDLAPPAGPRELKKLPYIIARYPKNFVPFQVPWVKNSPTLHQYCWRIATGDEEGQCFHLSAAHILVCEALGVQRLRLGRPYPWGRRSLDPPYAERPGALRGRYEAQDVRKLASGGSEEVRFVDANGLHNAFEAVACYLAATSTALANTYRTAAEA